MEIFFTSDTHFNHRNILKHCGRPFKTIEEHDDTLISNWNALIAKNDHVYHLGDFAFNNVEYNKKLCSKLNGKIFLLRGNHDRSNVLKKIGDRFEWIKDVHMFKGQYLGDKVEIFLSHYPHRSWNKSFHGVGHLFGHVHGRLEPYFKSFDVGVDCWDYKPVHLKQVIDKFNQLG